MISLLCYLNERYQRYRLNRLDRLEKKLEEPISIDLTSLRSKFTVKSSEKKDTRHSNDTKIIINLSITYDTETHQSQVSELKVVQPQ